VRLAGENDQLRTEVAMLREELRIKDARLARIEPRNRPHYPPAERLAILALRAARGWGAAATARRFHLTAQTVAAWMKRLDEDGPSALARLAEPVNRFPDFVRAMVAQLRAVVPAAGKVRIAQVLARAGLHLAPTTVTVRRMLHERPLPEKPKPCNASTTVAPERVKPPRTVTAKYPHHVWHLDFTLVPIVAGLWVPWFPFAALQRWPFCWVVAVVLDHASRAVVHAEVFAKGPTAAETLSLLDSAIGISGRVPRYIVTDRGCQFREEYRDWCAQRGIQPRFGALGQHGSIAVVERFMRTLKEERFAGSSCRFGSTRCGRSSSRMSAGRRVAAASGAPGGDAGRGAVRPAPCS
jgi:transposase InsO family protein